MTKNNKRILIIEDDRDIRRTLELRLRMEGFEVLAASDGYEGIYKARALEVDFIILDLKLPGLPGEEICKALRKEEKYQTLPIIMLTAKDTDADKVVGRVIGANYYISKPFDMEDLLEKINSFFK